MADTEEDTVWKGNEDLRPLLVPLDEIELLPGNPHRGDVNAVARSLERFGQRKSISGHAELEGDGSKTVLAGNTTVQAASLIGWTHIAVSWSQDEDPREAAGYALADNRTSELGANDPVALAEFTQMEVEGDMEILKAAGYDELDIEDVLAAANEAEIEGLGDDGEGGGGGDDGGPLNSPVIQYAIIFDSEDQQQTWFSFVRWLKTEFPDTDTLAERLDAYLRTLPFFED